jgi:hypothetical protein
MRLELGLSNLQDDLRTNHPVVRVTATIEEGDMVTVGSQYSQEFSLESLGNFLGEVRDDQALNVEADGVLEEEEDQDANELNAEDKAEEDSLENDDLVDETEDENNERVN